MEYLSPKGVLLPLVYGTTASPLWLELRGRSTWQATLSWTVYRLASHRLLPWLRVTFAMVPDAAWPCSDQWPWSTAPATGPVGRLGHPSVSDPWGVGSFLSLGRPTCVQCPGPLGSCSPVCSCGMLLCLCGVLGHMAPVHRCARSVGCVACAVSWATWLLFTGVPARSVVLRVRCPGPLGSCSPVCPLGGLCCVCGVLGHLAPLHRCARAVCCVACAVSRATWLLFTGVPAWCVVLRVRCPGPPGCCSPVCRLRVLCCVCGVPGHLAPVHRCARAVCCFACAVSWASRLLFTGVPALCVVLRVRCPGPLGSCSVVCRRGVLCCVCGVLGHLAPVHRCARTVCCVACVVSWATWLLLASVPALCVGGVCGVLGHLAPVHQCACSVCCVARAVSSAPWLLFGGVPALCVVLCVRCPGPLGSRSPVCPLGVLCCACGVLGRLATVHRCARSLGCVACAVSWATWLLFTGVPVRCVVWRGRCPGPLGSCSLMCPCGVLCCVCGVLGHLAPVHRCARSVGCVACAVSWATWLLLTGVPAWCVVLRVRCPGPPGSCPPVCPLGVLFCVCGVLGLLAPVHRYARSVCSVACAVSWATWLLFTDVPARCVVLRVRCPRPLGSCSLVCPLGVLCCVCGVLGNLAPVCRCGRSVCWWRVWCPGPLGSCSPMCLLGVLGRACGVLGPLAPVHPCARWVCCVVCTVSWAAWLLFTGVFALCAVRGVLLWGASLRGAYSSILTAAVRSRQGLGTLRARTRPSGRRLFVAGRGWVPSGRALVHPDGGCSVAGRGWVPSGRALIHMNGSWCCLAPVPVLWFVACCARSPSSRHPAAVVAWHLSVCLGCGRRRASLACLVTLRGAPRLVGSRRSRCSSQLSRRRGAFPRPGGLRPRLYWVAARGTRRPAENHYFCIFQRFARSRSCAPPFSA